MTNPNESLNVSTGTRIEDSQHNKSYVVIRKLGKGGMGEVYQVRDSETEDVFALKATSFNEENLQRVQKDRRLKTRQETLEYMINRIIEHEARLPQELDHPNVIKSKGHFRHEERLYILMEYVEGVTLTDVIRQYSSEKTFSQMPEEVVIKYSIQLFSAIKYLVQNNVTHRDVKPDNLLITDEGKLVLSDFGVCAVFDDENHQTRPQGTPNYRAPETFGGISGPKSDVYSAGKVLYNMLTDMEPEEHLHFRNQLNQLCSIRPDISRELINIINAAVIPQPDHRLSADHALERLIDHAIKKYGLEYFQQNFDQLLNIGRGEGEQRSDVPDNLWAGNILFARRHNIEVQGDFLALHDIECVDADGKVFESYPLLYVARDVAMQADNQIVRITPYESIAFMEKAGLFLPSFALSCNILSALYEARNDSDVAQVLNQYNTDYHVQNSLVDWNNRRIIHYPYDQDFNPSAGGKDINCMNPRVVHSFDPSGFDDPSLDQRYTDPIFSTISFHRAMRLPNFEEYLRNLTGLPSPNRLSEISSHFGKKTYVVIVKDASRLADKMRAAYLTGSKDSFSINVINGLDFCNKHHGHGVRISL